MRFFLLLTLLLAHTTAAHAQISKIYVDHADGSRTYGSAVAISSHSGDAYFLTAAHTFYDDSKTALASSGHVQIDGSRWVPMQLYYHEYGEQVDLACFRVSGLSIRDEYLVTLTDEVSPQCFFTGYPNNSQQPVKRQGSVLDANNQELHIPQGVYPGDSGGPVYDAQKRVFGIVYGHMATSPSDVRATLNLCQFISRCPPGVQCRQEPQYYVRPLTPGHIEPPRYRPPTYEVQPIVAPKPPAETPIKSQPATAEQIAAAVAAYLKLNPPPAGRDGQDGQDGATGPAGPRGPAGESYDPAELQALKRRVEALEQRRRVVAIASNGIITDKDSYGPDEAIVIDLQKALKKQAP